MNDPHNHQDPADPRLAEPFGAADRPADSRPAVPGPDQPYLQRFSVPFEYPVYFTHGVFDRANPLLAQVLDRFHENRCHRAAVYVDAGVAKARPGLMEQIKEYFHADEDRACSERSRRELACPPMIVPGGEAAKNDWEIVREIMWTAGNLHLDRQSYILAVGGGAVLDMVGFVASIVHRGLRLVRLPTTTLAQNDAGVGVKNGMDEHGSKNFVGTFSPPFAVLNDFDFLSTLPQRDWIGGIAEAFKVAIIKDREFFDFLAGHADALRRRDQAAMEHAVRRCAVLHLEHIAGGGDPFEYGSARPLDFGHWSAHKLETLSAYAIGHGQAAAIGIALDSFYAMKKQLISQAEFDRIVAGLAACGLPLWRPELAQTNSAGELEILDGLAQFREHLGGALTITLPRGIGGKTEVHHMDAGLIQQAVEHLKRLQSAWDNPPVE